MSVLQSAVAVQDQLLDAMTAAEDVVLSAVKSVAERVEPVTSRLPDAPFADQMPDPAEVLDQAYGFAGKLLANQHHFALELSKALRPAKVVAVSTARKATTTARTSSTKVTHKVA